MKKNNEKLQYITLLELYIVMQPFWKFEDLNKKETIDKFVNEFKKFKFIENVDYKLDNSILYISLPLCEFYLISKGCQTIEEYKSTVRAINVIHLFQKSADEDEKIFNELIKDLHLLKDKLNSDNE